MAEKHHRHGEMDIRAQQNTFVGFVKAAGFVVVVAVVILILLTFRI